MYLRLKVEKIGCGFADNGFALPIDQIFHTKWFSVSIYLNQVQVSSAGTNYMYKAAIENLLNYNKTTKEIQLSAIRMTSDTGNFNSTKVLYHTKIYLVMMVMVVVNSQVHYLLIYLIKVD